MGKPSESSTERPIDTAIREALDTLFAVPGVDAGMVVVSYSDEQGNSYGECEHIGSEHAMMGCLSQFGMVGPANYEEDVGLDDSEDE